MVSALLGVLILFVYVRFPLAVLPRIFTPLWPQLWSLIVVVSTYGVWGLLHYWATALAGLVVLVVLVIAVGFGLTVINSTWLTLKDVFSQYMPEAEGYLARVDDSLDYLWTALKLFPIFVAASLLIYIIVNAQRRDRYEELYG